MEHAVRVDIEPRMVQADERTVAGRSDTVKRMAELGQIDNPDSGEVNTTETRWVARIGEVEFPLLAFGTQSPEDGNADEPLMLSLVVPASEVRIRYARETRDNGDVVWTGKNPPRIPQPQEQAKTGMWGDPSVPDPRADLPGWEPERPLSADVASGAEQKIRLHFNDLVVGEDLGRRLRQMIRRHGDGGAAGVSA